MKSLLNISVLALLLCFSSTAMAGALNLVEAKKAGLIGERDDGLVGTVLPNPSGDLQTLVNTTNSGRIEIYRETSTKQNIPLNDVRKIAAQKIFGMAASGDYLFTNGKWAQK